MTSTFEIYIDLVCGLVFLLVLVHGTYLLVCLSIIDCELLYSLEKVYVDKI